MLVLTRKPGESLRIGPDVRLTIVAAARGQVRIGIEAPDSLAVHREEVYLRIEKANRAAAEALEEAIRRFAPGSAASDASREDVA